MIAFNEILSLNWNEKYHPGGGVTPKNAFLFGMIIFDWDNKFKTRLRKYTNILDLEMPFQYIEKIPDWTKGANYSETGDVIGRFEPMNIYSNSGPQDFNLNLIYFAEALKSGSGIATPWTLEYVEILIKRIQSLVFPMYDGEYSPPPKLQLNIGNIYKDVPFIIKNISVESLEPFHITTGLPMQRKISLECRVSYPMWQSMSSLKIWTGYDGNAGANGPEVFAAETLNEKYLPPALRGNNYSSNTPF